MSTIQYHGNTSNELHSTELHIFCISCGFAYTAVRSDGKNIQQGKIGVEVFLKKLIKDKILIGESLASPKLLMLTVEDWKNYKNATECHICNKSLVKVQLLDSLPV